MSVSEKYEEIMRKKKFAKERHNVINVMFRKKKNFF